MIGLCAVGQERYKAEADSFLAGKIAEIQRIQSVAIKIAVNGDCSKLAEVRNSRNVVVGQLPENVESKEVSPKLRLFRPVGRSQSKMPLLVYFHGGGWTIGSINSCSRFCGALAGTGKVSVLAVDYSLAPESPFPNGLNDCVDAVDFALSHVEEWGCERQISLGGDSSGGNLAIAAAMKCQNPMIKSIVLFYPVTKAYNDHSDSWNRYGSGFGLDSDIMEAFIDAYTTAESRLSPLVSVANASDGDLAKLPATFLVAAERDILKDQGAEFITRINGLGVKASRVEIPGAVHLFITVPGQPSAFGRALELTVAFLTEGQR